MADEDTPPWEPESQRLRREAEELSAKLDDSYGSDCKVHKVLHKARKAERIEEAEKKDDGGWTKHTQWHWSRFFHSERVDYWPSTGKARYMGRMYYSPRDVQDLFTKLGIPQ